MSPTTRRSARLANSSPTKDDAAAGTKRKADSDDFKGSKRGRKAVPKKQSTIEESIGNGQEDVTSKDSMDPKEGDNTSAGGEASKDEADDKNRQDEPAEQVGGENETKKHDSPVENEHKPYNGDAKTSADANDTIQKSAEREKKMPSNILEKGILYFLTRNRVGIEEPESVGDLQRTYFVLRPLPNGAKLGDGAIPDSKTNRLLALPKKTLPQSHRDRFMAFVEKTNVSIQDLKEEFFQGKEYETKTMGTRHIEPVTPIGEGVYAITRAEDQSTHLAYMLTIPAEIGEVQQDLGLRSQGSFHISVKNPERPGPAAARLPEGPDFPKEIIEEFRGLAWASVNPKHFDYPNAQILLIGEGTDDDLGKALEQTHKDEKHDKDHPKEVVEILEHEDELRVNNLQGNDSIFDDLKISKKEYPQVPTTW